MAYCVSASVFKTKHDLHELKQEIEYVEIWPKCCPAETVGLLCELLTSGCKRLEKVKVTEKRYRWPEG